VPEDMLARMLLALSLVLGLLWLLAWILKKYGTQLGLPIAIRDGLLNKGKTRLQMVDVFPLDVKHRLVLVRRDDVEHLLLLGGTQPVVVETGIPHKVLHEIQNEKK
jgi:flagellar protein FliO/FliZ